MTSRFALSVLLVATLSGVCLAGSIEDDFYRSIRSPSVAGLDDGAQTRQGEKEPRDSWRKIVTDMTNYLRVLSENAEGIERSLEDLSEKVEKLDMRGQENYSLVYAKKLMNEQRAAIEALQAGVSVSNTKSYADLIKQTDEYVRPQQPAAATSYRKKEQQRSEGAVASGSYQTLQGLRQL